MNKNNNNELFTSINPYIKDKAGKFIVTYGSTGVGQTVNWLMSLPEPILYMTGEYRDQNEALQAIEEIENKKVTFYESFFYFDDVNNLLEFLDQELQKDAIEYKSAMFDGWSIFMNASTGAKLEDDRYESRDKAKIKRKMGEKVARDGQLYQSLASYMLRAFQLLRKMATKFNIPLIVTAHSKLINRYQKVLDLAGESVKKVNPKFEQVLAGLDLSESFFDAYTMPNFDGKMFLFAFGGLPDYIGLVEDKFDKEGKLIYPPAVKFERNQDYLAKWTGRKLKKKVVPLDYRKIFK